MVIRHYIILLLILITGVTAKSQPFPTDYFIAPLDGTLQLSGTFAELRGNHFHSGIDLRTNGKEGLPVRAIADGYVVRIKISAFGFGKAIYINHPNGYTSVYAHMLTFDERIIDWTRARQYEKESFEVDLFPPKGLIRVKKGEIIGKSGNSGSSEGPHLHFEIRETDTELPVDPQLFGFAIKDWIRPNMHGLRIYPEGINSNINGLNEPQSFELAGWGPVYRMKINDTIAVSGYFSLGVSATDLLNESGNRNGVTGYDVYIDSVLMFSWKATKFAFHETRYINSFIDYSHYYQTNRRYMRTHIDPGNKLSMYAHKPTNGIFKVIPGKLNKIMIVIKDSQGNESVLRFIVKGVPPYDQLTDNQLRADLSVKPLMEEAGGAVAADVLANNSELESKIVNVAQKDSKSGVLFAYYNKLNNYTTPNMRISLPGTCLYDSIRFNYAESPKGPGMLSSIHTIHTPIVPLHDYYDLMLKCDDTYQGDKNKLTVVRLNNSNKASSVGGSYENGYMKARLRDFGRYTIMADSVPPSIKPLNISEGVNVSKLQEFRISISDNLTGIKTYRGTLNGSWILMDYDAKNRLLVYKPDALLLPGKNVFVLTVEDGVGNITVSQLIFYNGVQ